MIKYYRGTTIREANELAQDIQTRDETHWTDSFEKAAMYARRHDSGAVVEVEMDEQPRGIQNYFSVGEGDSAATTIRQWILPREYFRNHFSTFVEETTVTPV